MNKFAPLAALASLATFAVFPIAVHSSEALPSVQAAYAAAPIANSVAQ